MANEQNLRPSVPFNELSPEEHQKIASAGGKASVQARREKKLLKEALLARLNAENLGVIADKAIERAKHTDSGFINLRDTIGEKPTDTIDYIYYNPEPVVKEIK